MNQWLRLATVLTGLIRRICHHKNMFLKILLLAPNEKNRAPNFGRKRVGNFLLKLTQNLTFVKIKKKTKLNEVITKFRLKFHVNIFLG